MVSGNIRTLTERGEVFVSRDSLLTFVYKCANEFSEESGQRASLLMLAQALERLQPQ